MHTTIDRPTPRPTPPTRATGDDRRRPLRALLLPLQLFLAAGWLRAGVEKLIDPSWWSGTHLADFLDVQRPHMLPFFGWFSDTVLAHLTLPVAWLVVEAQLAIGLCLLLNRWPRRALWAGLVLNVFFVLAGRVNPSAFYLVMELVLLIGLSRPVDLTIAWRRAVLWSMPAVLMLPFAGTLDPALVIDDPALMLSFVSGLAGLATLAWSAAHLPYRLPLVDLLPQTPWSDQLRARLARTHVVSDTT